MEQKNLVNALSEVQKTVIGLAYHFGYKQLLLVVDENDSMLTLLYISDLFGMSTEYMPKSNIRLKYQMFDKGDNLYDLKNNNMNKFLEIYNNVKPLNV